ncbi:MAG: 30S ribosomal protein S27e [Candidatus Bathyarchaeia archaeon]
MSRWENLTPRPRSKFLRVKCPDCGNEQVVFDHAKTVVYCHICGAILAETGGGKALLKGEVVEILE